MRTLVHERIAAPFGLRSVAYRPQGSVPGPHPREYSVRKDGRLVESTGWYRAGEGAAGGIVATAADEGRFLQALMTGRLLAPRQLRAMLTPTAVSQNYGFGLMRIPTACAGGTAYQHGGASYSSVGSVIVSPNGLRVAVVLANGNTLSRGRAAGAKLDPRASEALYAASLRLYCAA